MRSVVARLPIGGGVLLDATTHQESRHSALRRQDRSYRRTAVPNSEKPAGHLGDIRDAITDLVLNAVDAMPDGGTPTIRSRSVVLQGALPVGCTTATQVSVEVCDTGVGMSEAAHSGTSSRSIRPRVSAAPGSGSPWFMAWRSVTTRSCIGKLNASSERMPTVRACTLSELLTHGARISRWANLFHCLPSRARPIREAMRNLGAKVLITARPPASGGHGTPIFSFVRSRRMTDPSGCRARAGARHATGLDFVTAISAIIACINNAGPGLNQLGRRATTQA